MCSVVHLNFAQQGGTSPWIRWSSITALYVEWKLSPKTSTAANASEKSTVSITAHAAVKLSVIVK